ncbi:hypothetical protein LUX57_51620 [Actinomadura madurae]|nr:hypothetical protein [Actinomadura madurae]MCP9972504.1 hypothetical protein [Actinomadura madurae]
MPGAKDLRGQHAAELVRVVVQQRRGLPRPRRVHDHPQRPVGRYGGEHSGQGVPVGDVAGRDRDAGAVPFEFGDERVRALGGAAPAPGEQEMGGTAPGRPPGHLRAQPAGAAGDEDGSAREP